MRSTIDGRTGQSGPGRREDEMAVKDDLLSIERELWTGGADSYLGNLDASCLIAFTQMAGVMTREQVADTVQAGPRWRVQEMDFEGLVQPTDDIAMLTYRVRSSRGDEQYRARISSGYVRRNGDWKMMFHQQTPLTDEETGGSA
jgi:hypothetical protein